MIAACLPAPLEGSLEGLDPWGCLAFFDFTHLVFVDFLSSYWTPASHSVTVFLGRAVACLPLRRPLVTFICLPLFDDPLVDGSSCFAASISEFWVGVLAVGLPVSLGRPEAGPWYIGPLIFASALSNDDVEGEGLIRVTVVVDVSLAMLSCVHWLAYFCRCAFGDRFLASFVISSAPPNTVPFATASTSTLSGALSSMLASELLKKYATPLPAFRNPALMDWMWYESSSAEGLITDISPPLIRTSESGVVCLGLIVASGAPFLCACVAGGVGGRVAFWASPSSSSKSIVTPRDGVKLAEETRFDSF